MGYFYWLHVKSSNHLHTELNLGYLKGTKFCLDSKVSFIDISSIASFKESDPPSLQRALLLLFSSGQPQHYMPYLGNRSCFTARENSWLGEFNGTHGCGIR